MLLAGKKSIAEKIVYGALEGTRRRPAPTRSSRLKRALDNIKPTLEVKSRRVGGATYQVPIEVKPGRATTLALRWLVNYSRAASREDHDRAPHERAPRRQQRPRCLVKRREDTHKMAESNKAFAHYRW